MIKFSLYVEKRSELSNFECELQKIHNIMQILTYIAFYGIMFLANNKKCSISL